MGYERDDNYVKARVAGVTYVNVYLTSNCSAANLERTVTALELKDITKGNQDRAYGYYSS